MSVSAIPNAIVMPAPGQHVEHEVIPSAVARWRDSENAVTPRSYYGEVVRRLVRDRTALVAFAALVLIVGSTISAPILAADDPLVGDVSARLRPIGTPGHFLGTDEQGRDVFARLLYGGRLSLLAGIVPVAIATVVGTLVGSLAAYLGRTTGAVLMRVMDMSYAFPAILLTIAITASLGAGVSSSIIALSIVFIPPISRVAESATKHVMVQEYIVRNLRGAGLKAMYRGIQMVFQDPYSSVNPRMSIGENIGFPMKVHGYDADRIRERTTTLLRQVGLHANHASYFPHQMSGGQLQRVNIARALALEPKLVICDEPVSALDKSIQAQVLNLLKDLQQQLNLTYVFISHDLNVVEYMSDRVMVMYLGQVVEACSSEDLYREPLHPYTRVLLSSIPKTDPDQRGSDEVPFGEIPSPLNPPSGCRFRTRCPHVMDVCATERPAMREPTPDHAVSCFLYETEVPIHA